MPPDLPRAYDAALRSNLAPEAVAVRSFGDGIHRPPRPTITPMCLPRPGDHTPARKPVTDQCPELYPRHTANVRM